VLARNLLALVAAAGLASTALAQSTPTPAPTPPAASQPAAAPSVLKPGDKAPAIAIANWVKGEPITGFEKDKVYVVEFWATWCPPCRTSIPHLSSLQQEYKDKGVTIIGVTSKDPNNSLEQVNAMVKDFGDRMNYHVAFDEGRKTNDAYMKAAKQNGIPTAFIVDREGKLAWIGHPMAMDKVLGAVVAGKWNDAERQKLADAEKAEAQLGSQLGEAFQSGDADKIIAASTKAIELKGDDAALMNEIAWNLVDPTGPFAAKVKAEPKLADLALQAAQKADAATKSKDPAVLDTLARAYFVKGDKAKALETQTKAVSLAPADMKADLETSLEEYKK
jgi:thiol-disulfide isomerase/thioredoxin